MVMTDPIADMLTRIRNAIVARHDKVDIPFSRLKRDMAVILKEEGYIEDFQTTESAGVHKNIVIKLKYLDEEVPVIKGLKKVSRPGLRVYVGKDEVPRVLNGLGIAILSTSKGVLTDRESRERSVGGEVLCYVW
jgi:small subunit ribosomal protein S8